MQNPISITAVSSISAIGNNEKEIWENYKSDTHFLTQNKYQNQKIWTGKLPLKILLEIETLKKLNEKYKNLDNSVLYAIYTSRKAIKKAGWKITDNFGINIGSSRGATSLFENYHHYFLKNGKAKTLSSPTTTLGNISSWVAHDLQTLGPEISHSITCSTALHAMLNGIAWINAGMCNKFLVGGSEAPLTPFTVAQMHALKIYSKLDDEYPCRALDIPKKNNTMVLGEGASIICLEEGKKENALANITGIGYATEILEHNISISSDAKCFQRSMKMALGDTSPSEIDVIVMHAPGTVKGDLSEYRAIQSVFGKTLPALTTNKWKVGHAFGASGALSIELGVLMLKHQKFAEVPFFKNKNHPNSINKILVNAVGFGGNAVSILLSKN